MYWAPFTYADKSNKAQEIDPVFLSFQVFKVSFFRTFVAKLLLMVVVREAFLLISIQDMTEKYRRKEVVPITSTSLLSLM